MGLARLAACRTQLDRIVLDRESQSGRQDCGRRDIEIGEAFVPIYIISCREGGGGGWFNSPQQVPVDCHPRGVTRMSLDQKHGRSRGIRRNEYPTFTVVDT
jgi:hypothetical protein